MLPINQLYLNWGAHFWAFGSVLFFITLAMRGLFIYKESYMFTMRVIIVLFTFGGELAMTYFPDIFLIDMYNIVFALAGALIGRWAAEAWSVYHKRKVREARLPESIYERYKNTHTIESIEEVAPE